jgi:hypothetical protein
MKCQCGQICARLHRHVAKNVDTKIHGSERGYGVRSGPIEMRDRKWQQTGPYKRPK